MALGPIEVLVVAFPGNEFNGQIIPELERLVESDTIALIDGLFIRKDADGTVTSVARDWGAVRTIGGRTKKRERSG